MCSPDSVGTSLRRTRDPGFVDLHVCGETGARKASKPDMCPWKISMIVLYVQHVMMEFVVTRTKWRRTLFYFQHEQCVMCDQSSPDVQSLSSDESSASSFATDSRLGLVGTSFRASCSLRWYISLTRTHAGSESACGKSGNRGYDAHQVGSSKHD